MTRAAAQILIGLMFLFGVLTMSPKVLFRLKEKSYAKAMYLFVLCMVMLFVSILSFHYAYSVITEWTEARP